MRLLRATDLTFHEFEGSSIPPYTILSHRWEGEEVTYQELKDRTTATESKSGFKKILHCCSQALSDGISFVWVDTCCIDKSSSAELSEAINSMYAWYQRSQVCYAYLSDVQAWDTYRPEDADGAWVNSIYSKQNNWIGYWYTDGDSSEFIMRVMKSKWWTRGWTLEELIAPASVVFYINGCDGWSNIGSKHTLIDLVAARTGIDKNVLRYQDIRSCSIAQRMSWACERETTRTEDLAYCLLGIFGVNMPLLYGEGNKAFLRLQEEIMRDSDDQTLFAWQLGFEETKNDICGPLASHPSKFQGSSDLLPLSDAESQSPYSMTNKGLRIQLSVIHRDNDPYGMAILQCSTHGSLPKRIGLPVLRLGPLGSHHYARDARHIGPLVAIEPLAIEPKIVFLKQEPDQRLLWNSGLIVRITNGVDLISDNGIYWSVDWVQEIVTTHPSSFATRLADAPTEYLIPPKYRIGAILFHCPGYADVLVAFNIELLHIGRYVCRVFVSHPEVEFDDGRRYRNEWLNMLVVTLQTSRELRDNPHNAANFFREQVARNVDSSQAYRDYDPLTSPRSVVSIPDRGCVDARIESQDIRGQDMLVLDIGFHAFDETDSLAQSIEGVAELEGDIPWWCGA